MTLNEELDLLVAKLPEINKEKRYWLIRTNGGEYYDSFRENGYVAISHSELPLSKLKDIRDKAAGNIEMIYRLVNEEIFQKYPQLYVSEDQDVYDKLDKLHSKEEPEGLRTIVNRATGEPNPTRPSRLIGNQIVKFVYEMNQGDIVIIPSIDSNVISFGEIKENHIALFSNEE
ncbi:MAG: hypothetical protein WCF67_15105, partial [Chitinophagaceae bacterium]